TVPPNGLPIRFHRIDRPTLPAFSVAPITATARGAKIASSGERGSDRGGGIASGGGGGIVGSLMGSFLKAVPRGRCASAGGARWRTRPEDRGSGSLALGSQWQSNANFLHVCWLPDLGSFRRFSRSGPHPPRPPLADPPGCRGAPHRTEYGTSPRVG